MPTEQNGSVSHAHQRDVPLLHGRRAGSEPIAQVTHDIVFHCPVCGQVLLRTDSELFEGGDKRCPRTTCGSDMRLTARAVGRPPDTREWRRYSCNGQRMSVVQRGRPAVPVGPACGRKLFDSPTPVGRVWAYCPDPGCQHGWKGTPKAVYLGGGETPAPRIVGRAEVVIGGPRLPPRGR